MIRTIINTYWESTVINGRSFLNTQQNDKIQRAKFLMHIFYLFVLITSIQSFGEFSQFPEWNSLVGSQHLFDPVWSVRWIHFFDWEMSVRWILFSFFLFSFIGLLFWERYLLVRIGVFLSTFIYIFL